MQQNRNEYIKPLFRELDKFRVTIKLQDGAYRFSMLLDTHFNVLFIKVMRFKWNLVLIEILDEIKGANLKKIRIIGNDNALTKLSSDYITSLQCTRSCGFRGSSAYSSVILRTIGFCHFKLTPLNSIIRKTYGM